MTDQKGDEAKQASNPGKALRMLVIEDDQTLAAAIGASLRRAGFVVEQALNGVEGMKIIRENPPDLVLLDLIMPIMDGFEVLAACALDARLRSSFPIIVMSNLSSEEDLAKAKAMGAREYLVKSNISLGAIVEKAKEVLAEKAPGK
jgi:two-component system, chemotaxis family, chemotaxis protein CheY